MGRPTVLLYAQSGAGLIIPWRSGVVFQQQAGGYACLQDCLEGIYVPIGDSAEQEQELHGWFTGSKWKGHCYAGVDMETADFIDSVLQRTLGQTVIKVDRQRLAESHEAWIHVLIANPALTGLLEGFEPGNAVLTWPNSD